MKRGSELGLPHIYNSKRQRYSENNHLHQGNSGPHDLAGHPPLPYHDVASDQFGHFSMGQFVNVFTGMSAMNGMNGISGIDAIGGMGGMSGLGGMQTMGGMDSMGGLNAINAMGGMAGMASHQANPQSGLQSYQGINSAPYQGGPTYGNSSSSMGQIHGGNHYHNASSQPYNPNQGFNSAMRTVYLGNLPPGIAYNELISNIKGGALEQIKILEDRNCAFVTFIDAGAAQTFHSDVSSKRLSIGNHEIKVGWGKPLPVSPVIINAVQSGASRNVYIGNIDDSITEQFLQQEFSRFGPIDLIKILPEKRIAFVHLCSISAAMKAVSMLPNEARWSERRINYGKDRCASQHKGQHVGNNGHAPHGSALIQYGLFDHFGHHNGPVQGNAAPNRTVYLGSIHPDVTTKELCDIIRGGILQNIKYMPDKNIAFVTFIEPHAAGNFFHRGTYEGVVLKGKRLKIGWGKAAPIPNVVLSALQNGASRNVYIGQLDDAITEDRLYKDFSEFGDIELVNIIPDKNIGFVNFVDIMSAVKAVEAMKGSPEYSQYKIAFGKDRCGNTPRPPRESAAQRAAAAAAAAAITPTGPDAYNSHIPGAGLNLNVRDGREIALINNGSGFM